MMKASIFAARRVLLCLTLLSASVLADQLDPQTFFMSSADGVMQVTLKIGEHHGQTGVPLYRFRFKDQEILDFSALGLTFQEADFSQGLRIRKQSQGDGVEKYSLPLGKTSHVYDPYREYSFELEQVQPPHRQINLVFRLTADGIAFRYLVPYQAGLQKLNLIRENSEFLVQQSSTIYALPMGFGSAYETHYRIGPMTDFLDVKSLGLPLALVGNHAGVLITEANLHHYANAYLKPIQEKKTDPIAFEVVLPPAVGPNQAPVQVTAPMATPWRVLIAGENLKVALASNLIMSLNPPPASDDVSWIQGGKILFQWWNGYFRPGMAFSPPSAVLNGDTLKSEIDFCARSGIPFASLDGYEFDKAWYGGKVLPFDSRTQDVTRPAPEIHLPEVLQYAKKKGVKMRVWLHGAGLTSENMDHVLATYAGWGVAGVMVDFMGDDTQKGVERIEEILRLAAKYKLTVSLHGVAKPTGWQRTYPHLLTEESVLGQEYNKWTGPNSTPDHEVLIGIIRGAVGPMDTHQGSFRPVSKAQFQAHSIAPNSIGTLAHQLATYVVYENEQPMFADYPEAYEKFPEAFHFAAQIPVTWDETKPLIADLDQQVVSIARRSGADWYIGSLAGESPRRASISLSFLGTGSYLGEVLSDVVDSKENGGELRQAKHQVFKKSDDLTLDLAAGGGQVVHLYLQPRAEARR